MQCHQGNDDEEVPNSVNAESDKIYLPAARDLGICVAGRIWSLERELLDCIFPIF